MPLIDYHCHMHPDHLTARYGFPALRKADPPPRRDRFLRLALAVLLCLMPTLAIAAAPSALMSQAMLSMMDAMGEIAHRFKSNGNWSSGNSWSLSNPYSPYSSLYGLPGAPVSPYSLPGNTWREGIPLQSPLPGLGGLPGQGGLPLSSPVYPAQPPLSPVDGIWIGRGGEIVLVMYRHFRIYASSETYRDGLFEILGDRLIMYDPQSDRRMVFEYYLDDGRMTLRNEWGDVLLFKQLPIPIPPYTLFNAPASTLP